VELRDYQGPDSPFDLFLTHVPQLFLGVDEDVAMQATWDMQSKSEARTMSEVWNVDQQVGAPSSSQTEAICPSLSCSI